ncbi:MAG: PqqD family protein [Muribaculaceae bacterium]|nr:PqqD family protein [Muribaculaceae bacterium]
MKKKKGFVLRHLGDEAVIVAESLELVDFDCLVSLNSSAAYIWESLQGDDFDAETIASFLVARYEVDNETAHKDACELIDKWMQAGIIAG